MASEKLFTIIKDGEWHNLNDLAEQLEIPIAKLIKCARFLSREGMIDYQEDNQRIKIAPDWKILLPDETLIATK